MRNSKGITESSQSNHVSFGVDFSLVACKNSGYAKNRYLGSHVIVQQYVTGLQIMVDQIQVRIIVQIFQTLYNPVYNSDALAQLSSLDFARSGFRRKHQNRTLRMQRYRAMQFIVKTIKLSKLVEKLKQQSLSCLSSFYGK